MILRTWACWFSKLEVLRALLSGAGPKSWGTQCKVQILDSSRRSSRIWVSSHLWVASPKVMFMARLCSSPSCTLWCGFLLVCLMCSSHSVNLYIFLRGSYSLFKCRLSASMEEGKFRMIYCCLEPEPASMCSVSFSKNLEVQPGWQHFWSKWTWRWFLLSQGLVRDLMT